MLANRERGSDLYRIDLSHVVTKYIGETEKNLDEVSSVADSSEAVLLLDEADALLAIRPEVGGANDRYADVVFPDCLGPVRVTIG